MQKYLIKNIHIINEGRLYFSDVLISNERIEKIEPNISAKHNVIEIDGEGKYLLPGIIDDQVHFREPGLTHKANIYTEAKAAIAGGVTSFMEMPNTIPPAFTQDLLEEKYNIASQTSLANYSFFMGTSNVNVDEVLKTNDKKSKVCGIKIFMGSSTGNLLVDNFLTLDKIFAETELLIATHCEDEEIIKQNLLTLRQKKNVLEVSDHPIVRNEEACFESSFKAVQLAKKHNSRLHILHISTAKELQLFSPASFAGLQLKDKSITAEVCVHHLHFTANDYAAFGNLIKCNPAIKAPHHREALWEGLLNDQLDVIATDHAPHLLEEKLPNNEAFHKSWPLRDGKASPMGGGLEGAVGIPLVQHSLLLMLFYYKQGKISLEKIVQKMSHAVADCFKIKERGYIREGYFADLVVIDFTQSTSITKENIMYKCGWSPFEGQTFPAAITHTFVNGNLIWENSIWNESIKGKRLLFNR